MQGVLEIKAIFIKDKFVSEIRIGENNHFGYEVVEIQKVFATDCPLGEGYMVHYQTEGETRVVNFFPDWTVKEVLLHVQG